ncbi:hypothetical protein BKA69DRAFT_1083762 [Paraphysoderma sedebokerense]|nr:hypothetical protein BKA69DRAFT_1083762 [Paraphysoderma sedebokerense]
MTTSNLSTVTIATLFAASIAGISYSYRHSIPFPLFPFSSFASSSRNRFSNENAGSVDRANDGIEAPGVRDDEHDLKPGNPESTNLLNLLYSIAEDQARKEGYIHRGITCNNCGMSPVRGLRFKCSNCVDFDLCENCESQECHTKTHVFLKIRIPIPPLANPRSALLNVFYPGNMNRNTTLSWEKIRELQKRTHFDQVELEAIYEQFKSLSTANTFNDDGGIQKEIFEQCLGPLGLEKNLVTERIFQFFDADGDGVICFGELVGGLSILCKGSLDEKIRCAFKGYDLDGDGLISKEELHKMFKAYFHLSMELVRDVVKTMEEEMMQNFDDQGSKPVSAAFSAPIPSDPNPPRATKESSSTSNAVSDSYESQRQLDGGEGTETLEDTDEVIQEESRNERESLNIGLARVNHRQSLSTPLNITSNSTPHYSQSHVQSSMNPNTFEPVMEQMSQDAIEEMVEKTFHAIDVTGKGYISYDEFKNYVENDATLIAWFEALGTVF